MTIHLVPFADYDSWHTLSTKAISEISPDEVHMHEKCIEITALKCTQPVQPIYSISVHFAVSCFFVEMKFFLK